MEDKEVVSTTSPLPKFSLDITQHIMTLHHLGKPVIKDIGVKARKGYQDCYRSVITQQNTKAALFSKVIQHLFQPLGKTLESLILLKRMARRL